MKVAASRALALLAREPVPEAVQAVYPGEKLEFGAQYIIPKAFDPRLYNVVSYAVAEAAVKSGVAAPGADLKAVKAKLDAGL